MMLGLIAVGNANASYTGMSNPCGKNMSNACGKKKTSMKNSCGKMKGQQMKGNTVEIVLYLLKRT